MAKKKHTEMESLASQLRERFPTAEIALLRPESKTGTWFLDIEFEGHEVDVIWRQDKGFGVTSSTEESFGEGADEVYQDVEAAYARVISLLLSKTYTSPPESVRIAELRRARGVTQESLASVLNVKQAAISKLEHREDLLVSTLRDVVASMGGELRITAKFPDGMERTLDISSGG